MDQQTCGETPLTVSVDNLTRIFFENGKLLVMGGISQRKLPPVSINHKKATEITFHAWRISLILFGLVTKNNAKLEAESFDIYSSILEQTFFRNSLRISRLKQQRQ